ncbi:bifunctional phosphopantothenoylcysteine decarboxylase/phosphopantothenate--cysteine ligase CoaBC [Candidatus Poribacteria bacterium]|nr:bifunctional phosphopantothenoylcysteine decarboxylase/phosphopantothenate--cysteine ligase CoaBC [Candidatus Poribacteria bacterium]
MIEQDKKIILLGISGGIAAYKSLEILRKFIKNNFDVKVIMTENAAKFVAPLSFSTLSGYDCITDLFSGSEGKINHIELARQAELFVCVPATANIIGKLASGIADDALTTIATASTCPKILVPAMNINMWMSAVVQKNIKLLKEFGYHIINPIMGDLACGDKGLGRVEEPDKVVSFCMDIISSGKILTGKTILITAGRTEESIDPIRYISNRSSGKMGFALAKQAKEMGAKVILVRGVTSIDPPFADTCISVRSAQEMQIAVLNNYENADIIIKAAAVSDYRPEYTAPEKIKKVSEKITINLVRNPDILAELGKIKSENQYLVGFAAETENVLDFAKSKLKAKNLDLVIANDVSNKNIGFESNDNQIIWIDKKGEQKILPVMTKDMIAKEILMKIAGDLAL